MAGEGIQLPYYIPPQRFVPRIYGGELGRGGQPGALAGAFGGLERGLELLLNLQQAKQEFGEREQDRKDMLDYRKSEQDFRDRQLALEANRYQQQREDALVQDIERQGNSGNARIMYDPTQLAQAAHAALQPGGAAPLLPLNDTGAEQTPGPNIGLMQTAGAKAAQGLLNQPGVMQHGGAAPFSGGNVLVEPPNRSAIEYRAGTTGGTQGAAAYAALQRDYTNRKQQNRNSFLPNPNTPEGLMLTTDMRNQLVAKADSAFDANNLARYQNAASQIGYQFSPPADENPQPAPAAGGGQQGPNTNVGSYLDILLHPPVRQRH